jgi:general secretion pathway protein I
MRAAATRRGRGFVLLEVIVSMVILGIAVTTLLRSFTMSLAALKRNQVLMQATVLADQLLQDMELDPPARSGAQGSFEEQGYPQYSWSLSYKEEEPRYRTATTKQKVDIKPLRHATLRITFDDGHTKRFSPIETEVYLMPIERWNYQSKFYNQLFKDDAGGKRRK